MDSNAISTAAVGMDTSNLQTPIITVWVIMTVLATFTVGLRFYTRRLILCILGPEDWLILVSMVCSQPSTFPLSIRVPANSPFSGIIRGNMCGLRSP